MSVEAIPIRGVIKVKGAQIPVEFMTDPDGAVDSVTFDLVAARVFGISKRHGPIRSQLVVVEPTHGMKIVVLRKPEPPKPPRQLLKLLRFHF